jgi:hypothetical protein
MVEHLLRLFPHLRPETFSVTSVPDRAYNCVAWAAGVTDDWWWPVDKERRSFWPPGVARLETLEAFCAAFATLGYAPCPAEEHEAGFEKVALFADAEGIPTHAARQLVNGRWTSKLGRAEDIEHALHDLEGDIYGSVVLILRRPIPPPNAGAA